LERYAVREHGGADALPADAIREETAVIPEKNCREAILDAAVAVVADDGAAHLTLDAVSTRANMSKGELLHCVRTKESLIEAMLSRLVETLKNAREKEFEKLPPSPARALTNLSIIVCTRVKRHASIATRCGDFCVYLLFCSA
jgi:AcrR family transcriptional regulator